MSNETQNDTTPLIEVKKPPVVDWGKTSSDTEKSTLPQKSPEEVTKVSSQTAHVTEKSRKSLSRDCSTSSSTRTLRSQIPIFTRLKTPSKLGTNVTDRDEKKTERLYSTHTKIPKSSTLRPLAASAVSHSRKSTPSRSHGSSLSSRAISPASVAPISTATSFQSKSPSASNTPTCLNNSDNEKEFQKMFDEMCNKMNKMKEIDELDKTEETQVECLSANKSDGNKSINFIMPAKDGAGETFPRLIRDGSTLSEKDLGSKEHFHWEVDLMTKKSDLLQSLSELNCQGQLNLKDFHEAIKRVLKINDDLEVKDLESNFYKLEQAQMELIHKLVKAVTMYHENRDSLQAENAKLQDRQNSFVPEMEEKLAILEAENTSLLEKLKKTTQNLEEERQNSQKRKITNQNLNQTKSRVEKGEAKVQQLEKKANDLFVWAKKLDSNVRQKESIFDQNAKRIKIAESAIHELEEENKKLNEQIIEYEKSEKEKYMEIIENSQELKDAKYELITLQETFNEEVSRREKTSAKLQETTNRLKSMEDKCRALTSLMDSAKSEVQMKEVESADKERRLTEEINQLNTELQARKVMLKVAEDDIVCTKNKLNKLELHMKQEQMKEREISEIEEQLRMDLAIRDEQITQLQEQIKGLVERKYQKEPRSKSRTRGVKVAEKPSGTSFNERVALTAQVVDLERTVDALAKDNLQLNQVLNQKNLQLDQRDRIVKMQTDVLKIRDELIWLLKSKEAKHEEDIKQLNDIIQERENAIAKEWNRALEENWTSHTAKQARRTGEMENEMQDSDFNATEESMYLSGTMYELYSSLEKKQMELEMMQQRVQHLEGLQDAYNQQRTRHEARISKLEMALSDKCLDVSGLIPILAQ
ncbi:uncharacterized protein LOC142318827 [Lycorma delicatula]|uniref:uncharacterized protein LOC142318827 n=1 Tax=Lycorma delicatula TaxID=130591 RepID=UPI003F510D4D